MTQFKEESLKETYKYIQRRKVDTKIMDLRVLWIVIRNARKFLDLNYLISFDKNWVKSLADSK